MLPQEIRRSWTGGDPIEGLTPRSNLGRGHEIASAALPLYMNVIHAS